MASESFDVIIVGAGPAGSTCAAYLSRAGVEVLLLDKEAFPRDKPGAGSQSEVAMAHVTELGALEEVRKAGYPNKGLLLTAPDYTRCYLDAPGERFTTPRRIFDNIMKNAALRWGARLLEHCWVYDVIREGACVCGVKARCRDENVEFRSRLVIGADGANSMVARAIDMFPDEPEHVGMAVSCYFEDVPMEGYNEIHFDRNVLPCYVWIFPSGKREGVASVGLGLRGGISLGTDLTKYFTQFARTSPYGARLKNARQISEWCGSRLPSGTQARQNYTDGCMLIGDAGSFVLPLTGEGVGTAMETAHMAAEMAIEAIDSNDCSARMLAGFARRWQAALGVKFQNMKVMEEAFRDPGEVNTMVQRFLTNAEFKQEMLRRMFLVSSKS